MNPLVLHSEVQDYIFEKSNTPVDLNKLILSGSPFKDITIQELAQQINGRLKAKYKLPSWFALQGIYYPPSLNLEQTSSEETAIYKSNLVKGENLIDLTGGFGIDDYYFSKKIKKIIHCELNIKLSEIATHNFKKLNTTNITTIQGDSIAILKNHTAVDWIYIDPSRRHDSKGKVFFLEDCIPNVPSNLDLFFSKSNYILIKTSPLLDIDAGIKSLSHVKEIHVIALHNEVKELVWVLDKTYNGNIYTHTINLQKNQNQLFSFLLQNENSLIPDYSSPLTYLYEPNAAILKSGGFCSVAKKYALKKLHANSHLYTSDQKIDFPGRKFEIISVIPYQKKAFKKHSFSKANITTRNFTESVSEIRKKFKIKDGGDQYLFFTTDYNNNKIILNCKKT